MSAIPIQQLLAYVNEARTNPQKFSQYVKKQMDTFINQNTLPLKQYCDYSTNEGKSAWKQAYQFLKNHKPIPPLSLNEGLNLAAMDHAIDMKINNFFDHDSSNGLSFGQRIQRRCGPSYGGLAQNLGTDFDVPGRNHALQTVMGLIIDDGVSSRGHRKNIFSEQYRYIGIYAVKVDDKFYTCMDFHSQSLKTVESSKSPLTGGVSKNKVPQQMGSWGKMDKDWQKQFEKMKLTENSKGVSKLSDVKSSGERYVTSKSTNTKTSTKNGKTTKITTIKMKYSDGSVEQEVHQQTY